MMFSLASKGLARAHPLFRSGLLTRSFASVGDKIPSVELHKGFPPEKVNIADYCKDRNIILLGLPGAFTPT